MSLTKYMQVYIIDLSAFLIQYIVLNTMLKTDYSGRGSGNGNDNDDKKEGRQAGSFQY